MQENQSGKKREEDPVRSAIYIAFATLFSRALGFLREMLMASFFSRTVTDAWYVAFRIPNAFRRIFGEGAFSLSVIPILLESLKGNGGEGDQKQIINGVFSLIVLIFMPLVLLGTIYAPEIVLLLVGKGTYLNIAGKFQLTVLMTRIMLFFCLFILLYAYFMSILNALKKFFLVSVAPVFFNLILIATILVTYYFKSYFTSTALAWGVFIGGFFQVGILVPLLIKKNVLPVFTLKIWSKDVTRILQRLLPGILSIGTLQAMLLINTRFASTLEEGSNSWLYWCDRLLELPFSIFAVSLGTALLPTLSELWIQKKYGQFDKTMSESLNVVLFLSIPCALVFFILHRPIVEVLFRHGNFTDYDLIKTSSALKVYALSIVPLSGIRILTMGFYVLERILFPAIVSVLVVTLHYLITFFLIQSLDLEGIVFSMVLATSIHFLLLFFVLIVKRKKINLNQTIKRIPAWGIGCLTMFAPLNLYFWIEKGVSSLTVKACYLFLSLFLSGAIYSLVAYFLKSEEIKTIKRRCS